MYSKSKVLKTREITQSVQVLDQLKISLAACQSSSEIIAAAFSHQKASNPTKYSLAWVCQKSKIPSRGYLSAVINGKRIINLKYRDSICKGLRLNGTFADFLKTYIDFDHARPEVKPFLGLRLAELRKHLLTDLKPMPRNVPQHFLTHLVAGAFSVTGRRATIHELQKILLEFNLPSIEVALENLILWGLVSKEGDDFVYSPRPSLVHVGELDDRSQLNLFRESMEYAQKKLEGPWFEIQENTIVLVDVFAVKKEIYLQSIERLRKVIANFKDEFKAGEGDTLVLFNVQLGPTYSKEPFEARQK